MTKLYVGIDVSKDKFDVSYTVDGQNILGHSTFTNDKKGIKKFFKLQPANTLGSFEYAIPAIIKSG